MQGTNVKKKISKSYTGTGLYTGYLERPEQRNMGMKFGTCNVSTVCRPWSLKTMAMELDNWGSYLVGMREVR